MSDQATPKINLPSGLQKPLDKFYEYLRSEKGLSYTLNATIVSN